MKIFSFLKKNKCLLKEMTFYSKVYSRFIPNTKGIKKDKYNLAWGVNTDFLNQINRARIQYNEENPDNKLPVREDFKKIYDNRIGHYITGEKIQTRIHPLHSKLLLDIKTGIRYIIDTVNYSHWHGQYIILGTRPEGSKSHKHIQWENISCHEPSTIRDIKQNQKKYKLIDKVELFNF